MSVAKIWHTKALQSHQRIDVVHDYNDIVAGHIVFNMRAIEPPHELLQATLCRVANSDVPQYLGTLDPTATALETVTCKRCQQIWGRYRRGDL